MASTVPSANSTKAPPATKRSNTSLIAGIIVVVVAIAAGGFWYVKQPPNVDTVIAELDKQTGGPDQPALLTLLGEAAPQLSDAEMTRIANKLAERDIKALQEIVVSMIGKGHEPLKGRLATLIAEAGAVRHKDPGLLNRAGLEYYLGRFVAKDYGRAETYFADPALSRVPISQYYLGEVLIAQDNTVNRDEVRGVELLRTASAAGIEAATKRLGELGDSN